MCLTESTGRKLASASRIRIGIAITAAFLFMLAVACGAAPESERNCASLESTASSARSGIDLCDPGLTLARNPRQSVQAMLSAIPDAEANRWSVRYLDYERLSQILGVEVPSSDAGADQVEAYLRLLNSSLISLTSIELTGELNRLVSDHRLLGPEGAGLNTSRTLGFDVRNARLLAVDYGTSEPGPTFATSISSQIELAVGNFDARATTEAIAMCAACESHELIAHGSNEYYDWDNGVIGDTALKFAPPIFDRGGRGGQLWVSSNLVVRTAARQTIERVIDAVQGEFSSLAEDEDFRLAARGLESMSAVAAELSARSSDVQSVVAAVSRDTGGVGESDFRMAISSGPLLNMFTVVGVGIGFDDDMVPFTIVVLVQSDEATAKANATLLIERLRQGTLAKSSSGATRQVPWAEVIDRAEMSQDGRVLMVKLYGQPIIGDLTAAPAPTGGVPVPGTLLVHD